MGARFSRHHLWDRSRSLVHQPRREDGYPAAPLKGEDAHPFGMCGLGKRNRLGSPARLCPTDLDSSSGSVPKEGYGCSYGKRPVDVGSDHEARGQNSHRSALQQIIQVSTATDHPGLHQDFPQAWNLWIMSSGPARQTEWRSPVDAPVKRGVWREALKL